MNEPQKMPNDTDRTLQSLLARTLASHFSDIERPEAIQIRAGRRSRRRLGAVRRGRFGPSITINPLLLLHGIPEEVVVATIAHELCHVVHGFGTDRRPHHPPHRGGRVAAELRKRGLEALSAGADAWIASNWNDWFDRHAADLVAQRAARTEQHARAWEALLSSPTMRSAEQLLAWSNDVSRELGIRPIHGVEWLRAGVRQCRLSYCRVNDGIVLLHGVLAHTSVPESVLRYEVAAWLGYLSKRNGNRMDTVPERTMSHHEVEEARHWRRYCWTRFRRKHAPK